MTVTFKGKTIVKVSRSGAITLDSGGVRGVRLLSFAFH